MWIRKLAGPPLQLKYIVDNGDEEQEEEFDEEHCVADDKTLPPAQASTSAVLSSPHKVVQLQGSVPLYPSP